MLRTLLSVVGSKLLQIKPKHRCGLGNERGHIKINGEITVKLAVLQTDSHNFFVL